MDRMNEPKSSNVVCCQSLVRRDLRTTLLKQRGCVIWFTGLSGSGKSTIARLLEQRLVEASRFAYVLDGDNIRHGLCGELGFSDADRKENIRRSAHVAQLFADSGTIAIAAFISPFREERAKARAIAGDLPFYEIHVATSIEECERRDVKGLYAKARAGDIKGFTGIDSPYEEPLEPELRIDTANKSPEESVQEIMQALREDGVYHFETHESGLGI